MKVYDVQEGQNITNNIARLSGDGRFTRHYKRKKGYGGMGYKVKYIHENKDWKPSLVVLTKRSSSGRLIIRVEQTAEPKKLDLKSDMEGDAVHKIELSGHVSQTFRAFKSNSMYKANPNMTKFIADRGCGNAYRSHGEGRKMGQSTQVVATNIKGENYKQNVIFVLQEEILADAEGGRISHAELRRKTEEALRRNGNKRGQGVFGYYEGMLVYGDTEQAFAQRVGQIIDEALKPRTL